MDENLDTSTETEVIENAIDEALPDAAEAQAVESDRAPLGNKAAMDQARKIAEQRKADREAGRKAEASAFQKKLKEIGYESLEQVATFRASSAKNPAAKDDASATELRNAHQVLLNENRALKGRITVLEKQLNAAKTETELRQIAYESDVDPEYIDVATNSLQKHYQRLDTDSAKKFDPSEWLSKDFKARKPGIFRAALAKAEEKVEKIVEEKLVNTAAAGSAPKSATATEVKNGGEVKAPINAMKMSRKELQDALAAKGLRNPAQYVS